MNGRRGLVLDANILIRTEFGRRIEVSAMIGKPTWLFLDMLPASEENCYQHPSKTGTPPLCK
jgi:hypothetical protein